jgi:hypothetical protein
MVAFVGTIVADVNLHTVDSELNEPVSSDSWNAKGDIESLVKSVDTFAPTWQNLMR